MKKNLNLANLSKNELKKNEMMVKAGVIVSSCRCMCYCECLELSMFYDRGCENNGTSYEKKYYRGEGELELL